MTGSETEQLDTSKICPDDGGDHAWGDPNVIYLCARPISKSVTIETRTCGKCHVTRAVTRSADGIDISDTPAESSAGAGGPARE